MKTTQELISLLSLIDDGDTAVRTAVEEKLIEMGEDVFDEMEKLYPELEYKFCPEFYFTYLSNLRLNYTLKKLKLYLSNPDPLLMDGLLLVTSALEPKLDKYYYMNIVQDMSDEIVEELSDSKTAIENLEKAVRFDPANGEALFSLANSYNKNGDKEKARDTYEKVIELFPGTEKASRSEVYLTEMDAS